MTIRGTPLVEMRDIALDFPNAGEAKGAVHLEVLDVAIAGLALAAVIVGASYGGAALATGSWASYVDASRSHADYIAMVG